MLFYDLFQVPIYEMRNDGRDNLLGALLIAGQFVIPEVSRGGRDTSWSSHLHLFFECNVVESSWPNITLFPVAHF